MPAGNGTGPSGMGPMTGRGMGGCGGGRGTGMGGGRGAGMGGGRGAGGGMRRWQQTGGSPVPGAGQAGIAPMPPPNPAQQREMLRQQAEQLGAALEDVRNQIAKLDAGDPK